MFIMPCRSDPDDFLGDSQRNVSYELLTALYPYLPAHRKNPSIRSGGTQAENYLCELLKQLSEEEWGALAQNLPNTIIVSLNVWQHEHMQADIRRQLLLHKAVIHSSVFLAPSPDSPRKVFPESEKNTFLTEYASLDKLSKLGSIGPWAKGIYINHHIQHAVLLIQRDKNSFELILLRDEIQPCCSAKTPIDKIWPIFYYPFFELPIGSKYEEYHYQHDFIEHYFQATDVCREAVFDRLTIKAYDDRGHPLKSERALKVMSILLSRLRASQGEPLILGFPQLLFTVLSSELSLSSGIMRDKLQTLRCDVIRIAFMPLEDKKLLGLSEEKEIRLIKSLQGDSTLTSVRPWPAAVASTEPLPLRLQEKKSDTAQNSAKVELEDSQSTRSKPKEDDTPTFPPQPGYSYLLAILLFPVFFFSMSLLQVLCSDLVSQPSFYSSLFLSFCCGVVGFLYIFCTGLFTPRFLIILWFVLTFGVIGGGHWEYYKKEEEKLFIEIHNTAPGYYPPAWYSLNEAKLYQEWVYYNLGLSTNPFWGHLRWIAYNDQEQKGEYGLNPLWFHWLCQLPLVMIGCFFGIGSGAVLHIERIEKCTKIK